jgi:hypothetical protein
MHLSKTHVPFYNEKDAILSNIIGKNSVFYLTHITMIYLKTEKYGMKENKRDLLF